MQSEGLSTADEAEEAERLGVSTEVFETCPEFLEHTSKTRYAAATVVQKMLKADVVVTTYAVLREEVCGVADLAVGSVVCAAQLCTLLQSSLA